jgi:transcriptional regulator with GAF, ATPase, and Fis domain
VDGDNDRFLEEERLAALDRPRIVHTPREPIFDDIASLAAASLDVPFAALLFFGRKGAWLKATNGIERGHLDRVAELVSHSDLVADTPRVCNPVEEPTLAQHPLVIGMPGIRFIASSPIRTKAGYCIGALTLLDVRTRGLSDAEVSCLKSLAAFVGDLIEARPSFTTGTRDTAPDEESDSLLTGQLGWVIGNSPGMRNAVERARLAAVNRVGAILILGETGTGKGLLARLIHRDARPRGPLVAINCGALPRELIESELFGYERGAFTGAITRKIGLFEQADGGTIFLDEIAELAPDLQVKLLSVLQEREFRRIGATKQLHLNVRVIAATNRNMADALGDGSFRSDLFFRIAAWMIEIPPLRERGEDVILLARHFVSTADTAKRKSVTRIASTAEASLKEYNWPGNVRELMNVLESALILENSTILSSQSVQRALYEHQSILRGATGPIPPARIVRPRTKRVVLTEDEANLIKAALRRNNYNKTWAARELGLTRGQLEYRLRQLGVVQPKA